MLGRCLGCLDSDDIVLIEGVRRAGKSTLMAQIIDRLLGGVVKPTQILRLDLEEPAFFTDYSVGLLDRVLQVYRDQIQPEGKCWLFMDEVQNIPGWEGWLAKTLRQENVKVFLTGSSSRLLARQLDKALPGAYRSFEVAPLSFKEFIKFNGMAAAVADEDPQHKASLRHLLLAYLRYGGFPEVVMQPDPAKKLKLLKKYFEYILYQDIACNDAIRDTATLRQIAAHLLTSVGAPASVNMLKTSFGISQDKVERYLLALGESYLIYMLNNCSRANGGATRARFKPYAVDTGLANRVAGSFDDEIGRSVENALVCHLRRRQVPLCFELEEGGDAVVLAKGADAPRRFYVRYEDSIETGTGDLAALAARLGAERGAGEHAVAITNQREGVFTAGAVQLHCIPAVRFFLE